MTMLTISGRRFDPFALRPADVNILDIAHALSQICRFGGHSSRFYSVAEHSVRMSWAAEAGAHAEARRVAHLALLHDTPEAYLGDIPTPIKQRLGESYEAAEDTAWASIVTAISRGVVGPGPTPCYSAVKRLDRLALVHEMREFFPPAAAAVCTAKLRNATEDFTCAERAAFYHPIDGDFGVPPAAARQAFLSRWAKLSADPQEKTA